MNASDRQYLSRFALDPELEFKWEDLYDLDLYGSEDEEAHVFGDENILGPEDTNPDDDMLS